MYHHSKILAAALLAAQV
jgi:predicted acylesterase/phospholipase RssA